VKKQWRYVGICLFWFAYNTKNYPESLDNLNRPAFRPIIFKYTVESADIFIWGLEFLMLTVYNGPTNELVCNKTLIKISHTYSLTYLLTPWSRVLLEKLTGFAANQQIPRIYWTRKFITVLTSARHMSHTKTLKITPKCLDHQMIVIRELFDPG
jgi:hypothetical protein